MPSSRIFKGNLKTFNTKSTIIQKVRLADADAAENIEFEKRYLALKIQLKRWCNMPMQPGESHVSTSDKTLARVLQQQGEIMKQLSLQNGGAQMVGNSDSITRLLEQQTQLIAVSQTQALCSRPRIEYL